MYYLSDLTKKYLLLIVPGIFWIFFNIFLLPFQVGSEVMHRPWLILNGEVPYRDFEWIRNPLDIFLLAGVFKLFGIHAFVLRVFSLVMYLVISLTIFFGLRKESLKLAVTAFYIYIILLFPLFMNTQIGEALVSLFILLSVLFFWQFGKGNNAKLLFLSGVFSGAALVTKQTSIGIIGAITVTLVVFYLKKGILKKAFVYFFGVFISYLFLVLYLFFNNALDDYYYYAIYFNLFIYREAAGKWGFNEGMRMLSLYASIVIPFALLKITQIPRQIKFLIVISIIGMIPTLLPSFWSYRLNTALPLVSIAAAYVLLTLSEKTNIQRKNISFAILIIGALSFIAFYGYFLKQYESFIKNYGISLLPYIYEDSPNDMKVAEWLAKNTSQDIKIFNTASNTIMRLSNRKHHNKYIDGLPWVYYPYDETFADITKDPPKVVVWDKNLPTNWPELKDWKFISYLHKNYTVQKSFNGIEIYFLNEASSP